MNEIYFTKRANHEALIAEQEGLEALREASTAMAQLHLPKVISLEKNTLYLEKIIAQSPQTEHWQQLADGLALLHTRPQGQFGWSNDNFIGATVQINAVSRHWPEFFFEYRLMAMIRRVPDRRIRRSFTERISALKTLLTRLMNSATPSLLHGDLWSGNVLFDLDSDDRPRVWLIDPAVYWGDAEADIAMTELFGGFDSVFYDRYFTHRPQSPQYAKKKIAYNLYHQLNHYVLFGDHYLSDCQQAITKLEAL